MAMMAVMAGDSERRAAATEDRRQQAPSSVSPWAKPAVQKRADAQREMRRQNGQRETKFLFSSGRHDFFLSESFCETAATALIRIVESCLS